jgi:4-amino-4-deoxy-L-arabinose transferase-like glycosyltransferase
MAAADRSHSSAAFSRAGQRPVSFLLAAAALGLAVRLAFALGYWVGQPLTRDEQEYLSLARSLAAGRGFVYDATLLAGPVQPFGRAPGYPAFLTLVGGGRSPVTSVPTTVKIAQSVAGAVGVFLIGLVACRLAGKRAARTAAVVAAVYPPLVWIAGFAWSEALFWPLGLAVAWLFDPAARPDQPRGGQAAVLCGLVAGLASLVRAATLVFVGLAAVWLVWRRLPSRAAALAAGVALVLAPWAVRNYEHYGRVVLIATEGGVTFWTGNHPPAHGEGDLAANPDLARAKAALRSRYPDLTEEQMEPVYYRDALSWMASHPLDWVWLEVRKAFYLIVPVGPSYRLHSARYYGTTLVSYVLVLPFAVLGFWRLGPRRRRTPGVWLLASSAVAVCLLFFPQERFRIPILDPTLIICAAAVATAGRPPTDAA